MSAAAVRGLELYISSSRCSDRQHHQTAHKHSSSSRTSNSKTDSGSFCESTNSRSSSSSAQPHQFKLVLQGQEGLFPVLSVLLQQRVLTSPKVNVTKGCEAYYAWIFSLSRTGS